MVSEPLAPGIALDPVDEALDDIGDFFEEAWDDTRDFIKDHPIISGALAIATGTWFISAAGGLAAAGAKLATGITNVIGSFTPTISSTSIGASINVGSFASASVGAGVNGLTAFAGANVSILGVPVWGVGSSLSALGSFGSTIGGSITNNLLGGPSLFGSGGSIDVGSFAKATVNSTLTVLANESGLTTVHDAFHATRETAQDIYRALAPPPPPVMMQPVSYGASGLTPVEGTPDLQRVGPSGSGDYNGTRLVGYSQSNPYFQGGVAQAGGGLPEGVPSYVDLDALLGSPSGGSEEFSWESVPFEIDWSAITAPSFEESYNTKFTAQLIPNTVRCIACHNPHIMGGGSFADLPESFQVSAMRFTNTNTVEELDQTMNFMRNLGETSRNVAFTAGAVAFPPAAVGAFGMAATTEFLQTEDLGKSLRTLPLVGLVDAPQQISVIANSEASLADRLLNTATLTANVLDLFPVSRYVKSFELDPNSVRNSLGSGFNLSSIRKKAVSQEGRLSPSNYPNPDPPMSAPPVKYEAQSIDEVIRMRQGVGPTTKRTHGRANIEAHHRQQRSVEHNDGILDALEMQTHRGKGNHSRHSLPSELTPAQRAKEIREYWKREGSQYVLPGGEGI